MVDLWRDFAPGPNPPDEVHVVIELTRGSRNKYEYDARNGVFRLNRVLYTYFPCDYGFIPRTLDDDGDPLDAEHANPDPDPGLGRGGSFVDGGNEGPRCILQTMIFGRILADVGDLDA